MDGRTWPMKEVGRSCGANMNRTEREHALQKRRQPRKAVCGWYQFLLWQDQPSTISWILMWNIRLKSENFLDQVPKSAFPPEDPPPPRGGGIPCATCVKYTIFRWRLRRLLSFSYALLYSLFSRFWLSFLMQNRIIHLFWAPMNLLTGVFLSIIFEFLVEFSHAKSYTNHYVRVLFFSWSISLQIKPDFSLWIPRSSVSIIETLCSKKWLNDAHRSRFFLRFVLRNSLLGSVISSGKILRFLIKTLKFSQGLRPWTR